MRWTRLAVGSLAAAYGGASGDDDEQAGEEPVIWEFLPRFSLASAG